MAHVTASGGQRLTRVELEAIRLRHNADIGRDIESPSRPQVEMVLQCHRDRGALLNHALTNVDRDPLVAARLEEIHQKLLHAEPLTVGDEVFLFDLVERT